MSSSRLLSRASPSRLKHSPNTALEPAQIPLPPSPPASDAHVISNPFAPRSASPPQRPHRTCPRTKPSSVANTRVRGAHRLHDALGASQLPLSSTSACTRSKRPRVVQDQFDSSSPLTSPTNRKSAPTNKRLRLTSPTPSPSRRSPRLPVKVDYRDSPNNPFLSKPGEKPRRADSRREAGHRQLIYVFRGKRIPYASAEDLDHTGGSPFNLSGPKLLFPSPPSPAPAPQLKFHVEEPEVEGSSSFSSPQRRAFDRNHLAFQTPKRDKTKLNPAPTTMLPTPQSRSRSTQRSRPKVSNPPVAAVVKSSRTMAKAMR